MWKHVDVDHENMLVSLHEPEGFGEIALMTFQSFPASTNVDVQGSAVSKPTNHSMCVFS